MERNLLHRIDYEHGTITLDMPDENGNLVPHTYTLLDNNFPTIDPKILMPTPPIEADIMDRLSKAFLNCEKLQQHVNSCWPREVCIRFTTEIFSTMAAFR